MPSLSTKQVNYLAAVAANDLVRQNHMLELWTRDDTGEVIGVFDGYDNKSYDLRETVEAVISELAGAGLALKV